MHAAPSRPFASCFWPLRMSRLTLVSSNPRKLAEFAALGLDLILEPGRDLPEVLADPVTVVLYKALAAGAGRVVEDTSLDVAGADVGVNVRWVLDHLDDFAGRAAVWRVLLGVHAGRTLSVYEGVLPGVLVSRARPADVFGFDYAFQPEGLSTTLWENAQRGQKHALSARRRAVEAFQAGTPVHTCDVASLPPWTGAWQAGG